MRLFRSSPRGPRSLADASLALQDDAHVRGHLLGLHPGLHRRPQLVPVPGRPRLLQVLGHDPRGRCAPCRRGPRDVHGRTARRAPGPPRQGPRRVPVCRGAGVGAQGPPLLWPRVDGDAPAVDLPGRRELCDDELEGWEKSTRGLWVLRRWTFGSLFLFCGRRCAVCRISCLHPLSLSLSPHSSSPDHSYKAHPRTAYPTSSCTTPRGEKDDDGKARETRALDDRGVSLATVLPSPCRLRLHQTTAPRAAGPARRTPRARPPARQSLPTPSCSRRSSNPRPTRRAC